MKKKIAASVALVMTLCVSACSLPVGSKNWQESDFDLKQGEENEFTLEHNSGIMIYDDFAYTFKFDEEDYNEYADTFAMARGLKAGDSLDDFLNEFRVGKSNAVWEIVNEESTQILPYHKETPAEIYEDYSADEYNNWLDIGFYKDGDRWKNLSQSELARVWFCDSESHAGDDIVILSVNLDEEGRIICISLYYFEYGDDWIIWQDWED